MLEVFLVLVALIVIFWSAVLFTNGVEALGQRLGLAHGAVGSIFAALGTALPETSIPVLAILVGSDKASEEVGIGAVLGAPLLLVTLGFVVSGGAALIYAHRRQRPTWVEVEAGTMDRDLAFFLIVYTAAAAFGLPFLNAWRLWGAVALAALYVLYVVLSLRQHAGGADESEAAVRLRLRPHDEEPGLAWVLLQTVIGLAGIIAGAQAFVTMITAVANDWHVSPFLLSVVITPLATELPETFNSVIWLGQRKDTLAMGNITGAMVFQSTLIPAFAMALTPWLLDQAQLSAVALSLGAGVIVYITQRLRRRLPGWLLIGNGLFYLVYLLLLFIGGIGLA